MSAAGARPRAFAALSHPGFAGFVLGNATAMLADNTEHVITYWMLFQQFHSPALGAFAVISHWAPYLLLAGAAGALADRVPPRWLIGLGMALFMFVSLAWGWLFHVGGVQLWQAWTLLALHGVAGVLWTPPAQVLVHELVEGGHLQSGVRLLASSRYLGTLVGPLLGNALLVWAGPVHGLWINALVYLPMLVVLARMGGRAAQRGDAPDGRARERRGSLAEAWAALRAQPPILGMLLLAGGAALCIGTAYQAQMPGFALDLGSARAGGAYAALLAADAAGAVIAVLVLESRGMLPAAPRTALALAAAWAAALAGFALSRSYVLALPLLAAAGFFELSFNSMAQTLVQLHAPVALRGRIVGLYATASLGLRTFSGFTVGLAALWVGIHGALALSAALLAAWIGVLALSLVRRGATR